jgi:hypothetical protein
VNKFQVLCSCVKCKRETTTGQLTRNHSNGCPAPPLPARFPGNIGRPAWNKGLTKDTSAIVKQYSENNINKTGKAKTPELEAIRRQKISVSCKGKTGGYRENAGRSNKYRVIDSFGKPTVLQSSYELKCSEVLNEAGIKWRRPGSMKYDGKNYFADFYLPEYDIFLDPKNDYKAKQDAEKIQRVIEQNGVKLYIVLKHQLTTEYINSLVL